MNGIFLLPVFPTYQCQKHCKEVRSVHITLPSPCTLLRQIHALIFSNTHHCCTEIAIPKSRVDFSISKVSSALTSN